MVENVGDTIEFYQEVLGFSVVTTVPGDNGTLLFAIISKDDMTLMLQDRGSLISEYPSLGTPQVQPSVTLYITVDDLDDRYTTLKARHEILSEIHLTPYKSREFAIADGNGYVLCFAETTTDH